MHKGQYKEFAFRLMEALRSNGFGTTRSPSGICMRTLSEMANASEQICRRYIRGDALPEYERVVNIAAKLNVSPGWLLFGEQHKTRASHDAINIDETLVRYILTQSHALFHDIEKTNGKDYVDFVLNLLNEIKDIDTSRENLEKIINLALGSIVSYHQKDFSARHIG